MCCYITVGLDASDTGHLVDATLWKLCVRTTEEVWFISLTPLTRIDFILIARINNVIETIILKSPEVTDSKLGPLLNAEKSAIEHEPQPDCSQTSWSGERAGFGFRKSSHLQTTRASFWSQELSHTGLPSRYTLPS